MLVLRIQEGQKIYINDGAITLTLLQHGANWAKIGVDAPISVKVLRQGACLEGPSRCCKCGGKLPPASSDGLRLAASTACRGEPDSASGKCGAFIGSSLWSDVAASQEPKDGAG